MVSHCELVCVAESEDYSLREVVKEFDHTPQIESVPASQAQGFTDATVQDMTPVNVAPDTLPDAAGHDIERDCF